MQVRRVDHPMEFLALTAEFRAREPVSTNVIGSVATSVAHGVAYDDYFWWVIENDDHGVMGCAMRTAPWKLAVPELDLSAAQALGAAVAQADPGLPGVNGPRPVVDAVYHGMGVISGVEYGRESHLLVLHHLQPAPATQGAPRMAQRSDLDLVLDWFRQFEQEADAVSPDRDDLWRERVEAKVVGGAVLLWKSAANPCHWPDMPPRSTARSDRSLGSARCSHRSGGDVVATGPPSLRPSSSGSFPASAR